MSIPSVEELARLIDPVAWANDADQQSTIGAGFRVTMGRIESVAAAERVRARLVELAAEEENWNEAIDWLLNSRHTGDPDIQTAFWGIADGKFTREYADGGVFTEEDRRLP